MSPAEVPSGAKVPPAEVPSGAVVPPGSARTPVTSTAAAGASPRAQLGVALDATPLLGTPTGVGRFCIGALGALGRRPELRVTAFAVTWRRRGALAPLVPAGVTVRQRPMPARPLHWAWGRWSLPALEWFAGPADVVHGTNFVVPPCRRAARVVTVHDLTALRYPQLADPTTLSFPGLVRRAVVEGAWVHTPSRFVAEEVVAELGADPRRVRIVHHGVGAAVAADGDQERAPSAALARAEALPGGAGRYVLAVGTLEPRKDYPGLVRAFDAVAASHPDVALVVAGAAGWGADAVRRALAASSSRRRVRLLGYVDDDTLRWWLGRAAVLAFPSVYEGFGFPPLEAMAAGVPVVATAAGAVPEVVGDAGELVAPGDTDALAGALSRVLDDAAHRDELVRRGRCRAATFTWEACGAGLGALYADAAAER